MAIQRSKINQQAEKLVLQGKIEAAIQQYEQLVRGNPLDMNTINKIGDLYSRLGRKREAISQFNKIGEHYTSEGFFLKAIAMYKKIVKLDPVSMDAFERLAHLYKKQGLITEARSQFIQVADKCAKAGQMDRAINAYKSLLEMEPGNLKIADQIAALLVQDGRESEAGEHYVRLAHELKSQGKEKEANAAYQKAARHQPTSPGQVSQLARGMISSGDLDGALVTIERALQGPGDHSDLLLMLCDVHLGKGEHDKAEEALLRCMKGSPQKVEASIKMASLQISKGDVSKAFEAIGPHLDGIARSGAAAQAASVLEEMLGLDDRHSEVLKGLISMHAALGNTDKEIEYKGKLLDLLIDQGEYADAKRIGESLVKACPDDASLKERLEMVRAAGGNGHDGADAGSQLQVQRAAAAMTGGADEDLLVISEDEAQEALEESPPTLEEIREESAGLGSKLDPEDEDFITEHMTEADVFVKYGLQDRAVEQLKAVIERFPGHVQAHLKLKEIHLESGNREGAKDSMVQLARSLAEKGDSGAVDSVMEELKRLDPATADSLAIEVSRGAASRGSAPARREHVGDAVAEEEEAGQESAPDSEEHEEFEIDMDDSLEIDDPEESVSAAPEEVGNRDLGGPADPRQNLSADLMDLAADIDAALRGDAEEGEAVTSGSEATPEGQSLDEIVNAFKRGVEQQVDPEDYETHYNLGIAYKEMGLLDEAIGEFQVSAKGADFLVDSCSMLGLCFTEKRMNSIAVKWYRRGLESGRNDQDQTVLGMRYDLAVLLADMGEGKEALELFTEVYGVDSKYRDVSMKIKELQTASPG